MLKDVILGVIGVCLYIGALILLMYLGTIIVNS